MSDVFELIHWQQTHIVSALNEKFLIVFGKRVKTGLSA